jgi:hypothetical protein
LECGTAEEKGTAAANGAARFLNTSVSSIGIVCDALLSITNLGKKSGGLLAAGAHWMSDSRL